MQKSKEWQYDFIEEAVEENSSSLNDTFKDILKNAESYKDKKNIK